MHDGETFLFVLPALRLAFLISNTLSAAGSTTSPFSLKLRPRMIRARPNLMVVASKVYGILGCLDQARYNKNELG
jgi:hypothetical protein